MNIEAMVLAILGAVMLMASLLLVKTDMPLAIAFGMLGLATEGFGAYLGASTAPLQKDESRQRGDAEQEHVTAYTQSQNRLVRYLIQLFSARRSN